MQQRKNLKLSYMYNVSYQILTLITPLITTPYISRILGANGIGEYSYTNSIITYFVLFATMGTTTFGQREISYVQDEIRERSKLFYEIFLFRLISVITTLCVFLIFLLIQEQHKVLLLILALNIISVAFDITWFFQGLEEFGKIVSRNALFRIINIIFIFLFVHEKNDLNLYILGMCGITLLSNISLWLCLHKYIELIPIREIRFWRHLRVILSLFVPTIAIQIYTVLDKTMIGLFTDSSFENGYFEQAEKIVKMVLTLLTSLGTVMIPRIGYHFIRNEQDQVRMYMYRGYNFVWCLGVPLCLGLVSIADNFVPWFFGSGYEKVVPLLSIFSFLILAIGINNVTGMQYLIPTKRQNLFTLTVCVGAGVNLVLNLLLIPQLYSIGAAIASVSAETVIAIIQLIIVRKELSLIAIVRSAYKYMIAGIGMYIVLNIEGCFLSATWYNTILMIVTGIVIYVGELVLLKDIFFLSNAKEIAEKISKKIGK